MKFIVAVALLLVLPLVLAELPPTFDYAINDTTPTFFFTTHMNTSCRIADAFLTYKQMNASRNCDTFDGTTQLCTVSDEDELFQPQNSLYVSCIDTQNTSLEALVHLNVTLNYLEENASVKIFEGIRQSVIGQEALIYPDYELYLRNEFDQEFKDTVDYIVFYKSKLWFINYQVHSRIGLINISDQVVSLDMTNITLSSIPYRVSSFINQTYVDYS